MTDVRSDLYYLISFRHLFRSRAFTNHKKIRTYLFPSYLRNKFQVPEDLMNEILKKKTKKKLDLWLLLFIPVVVSLLISLM